MLIPNESPPRIDWFEPLVRQSEAAAYKLAMMLTRNPGLAEEIVQEAFVRAWVAQRTPQTYDEFRPWLYRIIVNLIHDHHRREAIERRYVAEPAVADPVSQSERRLDISAVSEAMNRLSQREREVVYLRFFENASHRQVARMVGMNEVGVRVLLHRALKRIRQAIEATPDMGLHTKAV